LNKRATKDQDPKRSTEGNTEKESMDGLGIAYGQNYFVEPSEIAKLLSCNISVNNGRSDEVVTIAVLRRNPESREYEALLEIRGAEPEAGSWALPGGHVEPGEEPEHAAIRELGEETHLQVSDLTYLKTYHTEHGIKDHLYTVLSKSGNIRAGSDADKVKWVSIDVVPELAFNHNEMLQLAVEQLLDPEPVSEDIQNIEIILERKKKELDKGILICTCGIDGSGKTTATSKVIKWLKSKGYEVATTKWNSHPTTSPVIAKLKEEKTFTPMLYSLLHASDMLLRYKDVIVPALLRKKIVICDRYIYTSMVRDGLRGVDQQTISKIYADLKEPDMIIHCKVPADVAVQRVLQDGPAGYYSSGMDLGLANTKEESLEKYERMMDKEYERILPRRKGYFRVDTMLRPNKVVELIKDEIKKRFL
jgi:dTMP kinase